MLYKSDIKLRFYTRALFAKTTQVVMKFIQCSVVTQIRRGPSFIYAQGHGQGQRSRDTDTADYTKIASIGMSYSVMTVWLSYAALTEPVKTPIFVNHYSTVRVNQHIQLELCGPFS